KNIPGGGSVEKSMLYATADHVLRKIGSRLSELYFENLLKLKAPIGGVKEWLDAVSTARVPCAIVSCLDRRTLVEALKHLGLSKYFQAIVMEEDGMESVAHKFLSATVK
ncbi:hypothetical protein MKX01_016328, partial [Papaver californicum]